MPTTYAPPVDDLKDIIDANLEYDPAEMDFDACAEALDEYQIAFPQELIAILNYLKRQQPPIRTQTWVSACRRFRKLMDQLNEVQSQLREFE